jgi:hypothetical protein
MAGVLQLLGLLLITAGVCINFGVGWALFAGGLELVLVGVAGELRPSGST